MDDNRTDILVRLLTETDNGVKVSENPTGEEGVWLPKSLIVMTPQEDDYVLINLPVWLAKRTDLA
jgi:hypothetical protein